MNFTSKEKFLVSQLVSQLVVSYTLDLNLMSKVVGLNVNFLKNVMEKSARQFQNFLVPHPRAKNQETIEPFRSYRVH